jgi:transposase
MLLDQTKWHGARALKILDCVTLMPLPPRSPEPKPAERVWLHLRERDLSHRLLDDYHAVLKATCEARRRFHE